MAKTAAKITGNIDGRTLERSIESLHRTAETLADASAANYPDAVRDALIEVHGCFEELHNILYEAGIIAEDQNS
jgi:tRNA A-37 threonylcarbamoyl transferase component Bud32